LHVGTAAKTSPLSSRGKPRPAAKYLLLEGPESSGLSPAVRCMGWLTVCVTAPADYSVRKPRDPGHDSSCGTYQQQTVSATSISDRCDRRNKVTSQIKGTDMTTTQNDPMTEELLTVAEMAARMRVSKMTVYRLVQSGALNGVRFGRSYRVPETAVEQYLDSITSGH
jgi:excisionase family DNA binding protein